jgi:uncharacterized protein YerC
MRKVSTFKNSKLQKEQFRILVEILSSIKDREACFSFLNILLTQSEKAIISQRLDILRLAHKGFKYSQIQEKFNTTANTIARAVASYENSSQKDRENFDLIITGFKYLDPKSIRMDSDKSNTPTGGIRQLLRVERKFVQKKKSDF